VDGNGAVPPGKPQTPPVPSRRKFCREDNRDPPSGILIVTKKRRRECVSLVLPQVKTACAVFIPGTFILFQTVCSNAQQVWAGYCDNGAAIFIPGACALERVTYFFRGIPRVSSREGVFYPGNAGDSRSRGETHHSSLRPRESWHPHTGGPFPLYP